MNETLKRGISGSIYVILLLFCIHFSKQSFFILFGAFLLISVFEFCKLIDFKSSLPFLFASFLYGTYVYFLYNKLYIPEYLENCFLIVTLIISIRLIGFLFDKKEIKVTTFLKIDFLLGYVIFPFLILSKIPFGQNNQYNPKIITGIFVIIWTNDTFAYLVGKSFGKHKLFERISPKKTIEGFIGGLFFAVSAGFLYSKYCINPTANFQSKSQLIWMVTGVLIGLFGTIGDLIESKFKRLAGVKDSGKIMPGHGGILDRLDSVIFVAPFIYLFYKILTYVS